MLRWNQWGNGLLLDAASCAATFTLAAPSSIFCVLEGQTRSKPKEPSEARKTSKEKPARTWRAGCHTHLPKSRWLSGTYL